MLLLQELDARQSRVGLCGPWRRRNAAYTPEMRRTLFSGDGIACKVGAKSRRGWLDLLQLEIFEFERKCSRGTLSREMPVSVENKQARCNRFPGEI